MAQNVPRDELLLGILLVAAGLALPDTLSVVVTAVGVFVGVGAYLVASIGAA